MQMIYAQMQPWDVLEPPYHQGEVACSRSGQLFACCLEVYVPKSCSQFLNALVYTGARMSGSSHIACWACLNVNIRSFKLFCYFRDQETSQEALATKVVPSYLKL
jgi:hypothetical protein